MERSILKQPWFLILLAGAIISVFIFFSGGTKEKENIALTINGSNILRSELEKNINRYMSEVGGEIEEAEKAVFEDMLNEIIILQEAEKEGMSLSYDSKEAEDVYQEVLSYFGGDEGLAKYMEEENITEEELQSLIIYNAAVGFLYELYISKVNVSEEDVLGMYELYKSFSEEGEEFPELDEIREDITHSLAQEEAGMNISAMIEERKVSAEISCSQDFVSFCN